jgi:uncharacterized phage protein (TIGR01671 family)
MREIKFRAWVTYYNGNSEMVVPDFINNTNAENSCSQFVPYEEPLDYNKDCILMQYTGLKDKNGVDIYFDDIVLNGKKKYQVYWCPLLCEIQLFDGDDGYLKITDFALIELEVIGNIYEDKELLK